MGCLEKKLMLYLFIFYQWDAIMIFAKPVRDAVPARRPASAIPSNANIRMAAQQTWLNKVANQRASFGPANNNWQRVSMQGGAPPVGFGPSAAYGPPPGPFSFPDVSPFQNAGFSQNPGPFGPPSFPIGTGSWGPPAPSWSQPPNPVQGPGPGPGASPPWAPQPSQWPFVNTGSPVQPGPWGAQPPPFPPQGSGPPLPGIAVGPWGATPLDSTQWQSTSLGTSPVAGPFAPWRTPGSIVGGPQLGPQGPWGGAGGPGGFGGQPPPNFGGAGFPPFMPPPYIQSGYDSAQGASQNPRVVASPKLTQTQLSQMQNFREPADQSNSHAYILVDGGREEELAKMQMPLLQLPNQANFAKIQMPPVRPSVKIDSNNAGQWASQISTAPLGYPGSAAGVDYINAASFQPSPPQLDKVSMARDISGASELNQQAQNHRFTLSTDSTIVVAQQPLPPTDDPYAMNPNILLGGPVSVAYPDLHLTGDENERGAEDRPLSDIPLEDTRNTTVPLSANSIRIGNILSFPHGTPFGAVPPSVSAISNVKGSNGETGKVRSSFAFMDSSTRSPLGKITRSPLVKADKNDRSQLPKIIRTQNFFIPTTMPATTPITSDPNSSEVLPNPKNGSVNGNRKNVPTAVNKTSRRVTENSSGATNPNPLTEAILKQIQELKVVLYGRSNCSACQETEALLKNYSIPVYYFELDSTTNGEKMLTVVQQMTHSLETPLTFICGRFVGGRQRLHDLHANDQILPLISECMPTQRRSASPKIHRGT